MAEPRRRVLRVVVGTAVLSTSGCVNSGTYTNDPTTNNSTSNTGTRSTIPAPQGSVCPDSPRVPEANPHPDGEEIPQLPDFPGSLDLDQLTEYVHRYELVYRWRKKTEIDKPIKEAFLDVFVSNRATGSNWVILDVTGQLVCKVDYEPEVTDSPGTYDGSEYRASYLVTSDALWRAEAFGESEYPEPDPVSEGTLLECF